MLLRLVRYFAFRNVGEEVAVAVHIQNGVEEHMALANDVEALPVRYILTWGPQLIPKQRVAPAAVVAAVAAATASGYTLDECLAGRVLLGNVGQRRPPHPAS